MKKIVLLALCLLFLSGGCLTTPNEEFVDGVKTCFKKIDPTYRKAIQDDPTLDDDDKKIRLQTSDQMWKLIHKAEQQIKEGK